MKTKTAILASTLGLAAGSLHAQTVPPFINYQGKVTDSAGVGLGNGLGNAVNRKVIFRIFDTPSGNNRLWSEQHTVTISNGEFSVLLGNGIDAVYNSVTELPARSTTPLDTVFTSAGILRYVEIVVDNGDNTLNNSDAPISPRQQITSTAYCFRALSADTITTGTDLQLNNSANYGLGYYGATRLFNGIAVDGPVLFGQAGGALGSVNGGTKNIALRWNAAGAVGIGSADLSGAAASTKLVLQGDDANSVPLQLNIRGNADTNKRLLVGYNTSSNYGSLQAYSTTILPTNLVLNAAGGNVGIGTTSPGFPLNFANTIGDKISLWGNSGNNFGFGIQGSLLQIHTDIANSDIAFGHGNSSTAVSMTELMRIKGTGNVGIATNNPLAKLHVASASVPTALLDGSSTVGTWLGLRNTSVGGTNWHLISTGSGNGEGTGKLLFNAGTAPGTAGPTVLTLQPNGYVGMGTNNPAENLTIANVTGYDSGLKLTGTGASFGVGLSLENTSAGGHKYVLASSSANADIGLGGFGIFDQTAFGYRFVIGPTGNVGIGTTAPGFKLDVNGGIRCIGAVNTSSDGRFKQDIRPVAGALETILALRGVSYDWNRAEFPAKEFPNGRSLGFIGQEMEKVLPEAVSKDADGYYSVAYSEVIPVLVEATKQLRSEKEAQIDALRGENANLRERLAALEAKDQERDAKISSIEKRLASPDEPAVRTVSTEVRGGVR